ncbi:MAG: SOS response-associated peptidase [Bacteroidetes bacterium]|nr:MAG: SOS response-associated peptidase [Bacteroidota bacterium]
MCGRYTFTRKPEASRVLSPDGAPVPEGPRYNIAPTQYAPIRLLSDPEPVYYYRWGLIPFWAKDAKIGASMINARSETVDEKPAFRNLIRQGSRCLVLADSFYEWKTDGKTKQPYRIGLRSGAPFFCAGLTSVWRNPAGGQISSYTILTTSPNELMEGIHDRMPVILPREAAAVWMDPRAETGDCLALLRPYESAEMLAYPVSSRVGNVRNDDADLILPLSPDVPA